MAISAIWSLRIGLSPEKSMRICALKGERVRRGKSKNRKKNLDLIGAFMSNVFK